VVNTDLDAVRRLEVWTEELNDEGKVRDADALALAPLGDSDRDVTDIGPSQSLETVLRGRQSRRSVIAPDFERVGIVMARTGLFKEVRRQPKGVVNSSSAVASPGALNSHSLVLIAREVDGLRPGAWVLDPVNAVLRQAMYDDIACSRALARVTEAARISQAACAAIFTVTRPARHFRRYPGDYSLLWREAGGIQTTLHLAAEDVGLSSCVVGTAGVLWGAESTPAFFDTGAVLIGASK
jgi:SagB-type dehydrogenase family enzyme